MFGRYGIQVNSLGQQRFYRSLRLALKTAIDKLCFFHMGYCMLVPKLHLVFQEQWRPFDAGKKRLPSSSFGLQNQVA